MDTFNESDIIELLTMLRGNERVQIRYSKPHANGDKRFVPNQIKDCANPTEAAKFCRELDRVSNLYFVVGDQGTAATKTQSDIKTAPAFWLDLDVRADKGFSTTGQARDTLSRVCQAMKLPAPVVVFTGGGYHAYWRMKEPVPRLDWIPVSKLFLAALRKFGDKALLDDTARVTDVSSIMRIPGTYNIKHNAYSKIVERAPPMALSTFKGALEAYCGTAATTTASPVNTSIPAISADAFANAFGTKMPTYMVGKSTVDTSDLKAENSIAAPKPSYAQLLTACGLLRHYAEHPDISEVSWKYSLNVIGQCEDWHSAAHEFSKPYAGYDQYETDNKINLAVRHGKSTLCATLISNASTNLNHICATCPNYREAHTRSPLRGAVKIILPPAAPGNSSLDIAKRAVAFAEMREKKSNKSTDAKVHVPSKVVINPATGVVDLELSRTLPDPPTGYVYGNTATGTAGVFDLTDISTPIIPDLVWVSPVRVETITSPRTIMYRVYHMDTRGCTFDHILRAEELEPRTLAKFLMSHGMSATINVKLIEFVQQCADKARTSTVPPAYLVDGYGWHIVGGKTLFATPSAVVGEDKSIHQILVVDKDSNKLTTAADMGITSNLSTWCEGFREVYTGVRYAEWAVLASLASALFYPCRHSNYGLQALPMVFFGASGTGKTFAAKACQSVWANPEEAVVVGNSTIAAMLKRCVQSRHLPTVIDELSITQDGADKLREFILYLPQGREKSRSTAHGVLESAGSWNSTVFITTNLCISDIVASTGDAGAGAMARFIEINLPVLDNSISQEARDAAGRKMFSNHGILGIEFAKRLQDQNYDAINDRLTAIDNSYIKKLTALGFDTSDVSVNRFRRRLISMTTVVAEIMHDVLPFNPVESVAWALESLAKGAFSADTLSVVNLQSKQSALKHISNFLLKRIPSMYKAVAGNESSKYVVHHIPQPAVDTDVEFAPVSKSSDPRYTHGALEYATVYNQTLRDSRLPVDIVLLMDYAGRTMGYYINTNALNVDKLAYMGKTSQSLAISLGDPADGSPRIQRISMPEAVLGKGVRIPAEYIFILDEEVSAA